MLKSKSLVALTFAATLAASTQGYAQAQPDPHHPAQGDGTTEAAPGIQDQQGMSMPMMMNMMGAMMKMMGGGGAQMGMGGMDMSGMGMTERIEGRIAFLRAELQISDGQSKVWNAFAGALRNNAKLLKEANMPMMTDASAPQLLAQLDSQERILGARLEGIRAMKAALAALYEALTPDQRKTADELLAAHMGLMPSGMMRTGMMPMQQQMQELTSVEQALEQSRESIKLVTWRETAANHVAGLTPRQRQIMELVLAGHPSKNIAADIGISQRTVENHRASIMKRTGSKSLPALARLAFAAAWNGAGEPPAQRGQMQ